MGVFFTPVPGAPCVVGADCCLLVLCASTDGRPIKSVDTGATWTELDGSPIVDGATPVSCNGGAEPRPWFVADLGVLPAGTTTVNHNLGLSNPEEIIVQFWDTSGVEPLIANVSNRTANSFDLVLELGSSGPVTVVVGRSNLN
jgi:hypothetical protein